MEQLRDYSDDRLIHGCIHCNTGLEETRDHVPSKILLDLPYPANLPVVPSCFACNNSYSANEEYLACLIECAKAESTDPERIQRPRVAQILRRTPTLRSQIESTKSIIDGHIHFTFEEERVNTVILKLARGHAAYELSLPIRREPVSLMWWPIALMTELEKEEFDAAHLTETISEVGSRGLQRLQVNEIKLQSPTGEIVNINLLINDWIDVQDGRYRYQAIYNNNGIKIKIVISEFLACEVIWDA